MGDGGSNSRRRTAELPLVTFALLGYNQAEFARVAIEAAFAQDYPNLEILLSDDCSMDDTFRIMCEVAGGYAGPHRIVLNRNPSNQKIGGHINAVHRIACGELIVIAACDDVSLPCRTTRIVESWLQTDRRAGLVHSSCNTIDRDGRRLRELACPCLRELRSLPATAGRNAFVIGATAAWSKQLFRLFGDLRGDVTHEDCAAAFRSLLAGMPIAYVDEPLVLYREFDGSSGFYNGSTKHLSAPQRLTFLRRARIDFQQKLQDLGRIPHATVERVVKRRLQYFEAALAFESGLPGWGEILRMTRGAGIVGVARLIIKRMVNLRLDAA
jgi:hypothetical protein